MAILFSAIIVMSLAGSALGAVLAAYPDGTVGPYKVGKAVIGGLLVLTIASAATAIYVATSGAAP